MSMAKAASSNRVRLADRAGQSSPCRASVAGGSDAEATGGMMIMIMIIIVVIIMIIIMITMIIVVVSGESLGKRRRELPRQRAGERVGWRAGRQGGRHWLALLVQRYLSNTASFVFYGIACLLRLLGSATLFTTFEENRH